MKVPVFCERQVMAPGANESVIQCFIVGELCEGLRYRVSHKPEYGPLLKMRGSLVDWQ